MLNIFHAILEDLTNHGITNEAPSYMDLARLNVPGSTIIWILGLQNDGTLVLTTTSNKRPNTTGPFLYTLDDSSFMQKILDTILNF